MAKGDKNKMYEAAARFKRQNKVLLEQFPIDKLKGAKADFSEHFIDWKSRQTRFYGGARIHKVIVPTRTLEHKFSYQREPSNRTKTPSLVAIRSRKFACFNSCHNNCLESLVVPERRPWWRLAASPWVSQLVLGVELHEVPVHFHLGGEPLGAAVLLGGQG